MNYDLKKPCAKCPFRTDVPAYLTRGRITEIERALVRGDFACHETTGAMPGKKKLPVQQHCAGALILLEKLHRPSQMMRIVERLGMYKRAALDMAAPVFDTWKAMREAQPSRKSKTRQSAGLR